jgi:purine nucleosidase
VPQKIIIDTDLGDDVDDILAIAFALLRPELEVCAITTVSPFPDRRVRLARQLLHVLAREDIPVGAGMAMPLRPYDAADIPRLTDNNGYVLNQYPFVPPVYNAAPVTEDAIDLIIRTLDASAPGEVALVTIGPLTNAAVALRRKPEIAEKLAWIAMMGGEVHLNRREHNIAWDTAASEIVFTSGVPLFLGTWDVTRRFALSPEDCEAIRAHGTPLTDALARCIDLWWPYKGWKPGPVMYDLAPLLWSFDRSYYATKPMRVHVETRGEHTRGITVTSNGTPNAEVTVDMRADATRALYLDTILQR